MKRMLIVLFAIIVMSLLVVNCSNIPRPTPEKLTAHYIITNTHVIDVVNEAIKHNQDVVVKDGVIARIQPHDPDLPIADNVRSIEGTGKYLIPGLWDNHSTVLKLSPELDFPLYIANGVTSIRSNLSCPNENKMSIYACMKEKAKWKESINTGNMLGPSIQGWGTFPIRGLKKRHPDSPAFYGATTLEEARQVVEHYAKYPKEQRPYFLKTYNWIKPEVFAALSGYAKEHGFNLAGHMQRSMSLTDVVVAGQRSIAHARLFMFDCATRPTAFSDNLAAELREGKHNKIPLPERYRLLMAAFDEKNCQSRYKYLADNHVFLNPTLITRRNDYYVVGNKLDEIQGLDYVHYLYMMEFVEDSAKLIGNAGNGLSEADIKAFKDFYLLAANTIAQAQKAGVKILAGTDSWNEYVVPGFSLHEELQALSQAGLNNYAILQAASINGAAYFGVSQAIGSIDIGKQSDMVLLDANPIENIKHTKAINTVFKGGQIYTSEQLASLKSEVKDLSSSHLIAAKLIMMMLQNPRGF